MRRRPPSGRGWSPAISTTSHDTIRESDGYRVMPGIEDALTELIDGGTLLGLVTGNVEAAAHIKLPGPGSTASSASAATAPTRARGPS